MHPFQPLPAWTWPCQASLTPCAGCVLPPAEREAPTYEYCLRARRGAIGRWSYWEGMGRLLDSNVGANPTVYVIRTSSATEAASILPMTRPRWILIVFSAAPSTPAICLFS